MSTISLVNNRLTCVHEGIHLHWCEHLEETIDEGKDAILFVPGSRVYVPIFPRLDVFALVVIDEEKVGNSALMTMEFAPDIGRLYKVPLGFWNPGEGSLSVRSVILDYVRSKTDPRDTFAAPGDMYTNCPDLAHGIKQSRIIESSVNKPGWKSKCLWDIAMEKACTPCLEETSGIDSGIGSVSDYRAPRPGSRPF